MPKLYEVYLIRHAVAEERGDAWPDDTARPLSEDGVERMRKSARGLAAVDVTLDAVLTSPLVRARQTADIVADAFDPRPPVIALASLAPGGTVSSVLEDLRAHVGRRRIALVGHEPGLGELAARLAGIRRPLAFKKGTVCRIDVPALPPSGPGELRWLLTPRLLRHLR